MSIPVASLSKSGNILSSWLSSRKILTMRIELKVKAQVWVSLFGKSSSFTSLHVTGTGLIPSLDKTQEYRYINWERQLDCHISFTYLDCHISFTHISVSPSHQQIFLASYILKLECSPKLYSSSKSLYDQIFELPSCHDAILQSVSIAWLLRPGVS